MESAVFQVSPPETTIRFNPTRQADQGMSMYDVSHHKELKKNSLLVMVDVRAISRFLLVCLQVFPDKRVTQV